MAGHFRGQFADVLTRHRELEGKRVLGSGVAERTDLFKRGGAAQVRDLLAKPSVPTISDGYHHMPLLAGLHPVVPGVHMVGRALPVRAYPGDWAKPVEAIDHAEEGDVIGIDAGGVPSALWGELATHSAVQRKLAGVVIFGAIRDTPEIRKLGFPAFARMITARAGGPKGFGEIGVPIEIDGIRVGQGDWVVGGSPEWDVLYKNFFREEEIKRGRISR